ncbi:hypothetical protein MES5069_370105 [Mesorhizobium escarrei]|uniref:Uncharacterized protein n=1 Tax=Mesorhizobium escarrei TaxID=666018 RepID=A0ABM9E2V9_9HYPH|nr:hypothetical protein MES5069_370105 [Mesorhizobium escarrei]
MPIKPASPLRCHAPVLDAQGGRCDALILRIVLPKIGPDFGVRALVALAGLGGEIFFELAGLAIEGFGVGRRLLLGGDVGPFIGVFGVDLQPFVEPWLGVRLDRVGRAFRFADATVDALVGMDDEHVLALIETVDRTDLDAVHVFAFYAIIGHDIGHQSAPGRPVLSGRRASKRTHKVRSNTVNPRIVFPRCGRLFW